MINLFIYMHLQYNAIIIIFFDVFNHLLLINLINIIMIGNLIFSVWKLQWLVKMESFHTIFVVLNNQNTERSIEKPFEDKEVIIKQNLLIPLKSFGKISISVKFTNQLKQVKQEFHCSIQTNKYSDKLGLTPVKLILENKKTVKSCRMYCDIEIIKNSELKFQKEELKPNLMLYYNFQRFKLEIFEKNISEKVSMFDLVAKCDEHNKSSEEIIIRTNQVGLKKIILQTAMNEPLKKIQFKLRAKKIGQNIQVYAILENPTLVISYFQLELKNVENDEKVGCLSFNLFFSNTIQESEYHKIKGIFKIYAILIHVYDKQYLGKHKIKFIYGKQQKFGFMNIVEQEQCSWMQTCAFKRNHLENELRFQLIQVTNSKLSYAALFTNQFLDGTRYCNKVINLYGQHNKIGEIKIDFQFEQEKRLTLPQIK